MSGAPDHKLLRMIMSVARAVEMMERAYPRRVAEGKMTRDHADDELGAMKDVLAYLQQARSGQGR